MIDPTASLSPAPAGVAAGPARTLGQAAAGAPAQGFGALLEKLMTDAVDAGRKSETQATQAVTGNANLQEVVEAVNAAELTLQTVVAVRDRMIAAYQEILRMPM